MKQFALSVAIFAQSLTSVLAADPVPPASEANPRAKVTIDTKAPTLTYSRMIFGGFLEHFDHQVYGGIYDPGAALASICHPIP